MPFDKIHMIALMQLTNEHNWQSCKGGSEVQKVPLADIDYEEWQPYRTESCLTALADNIELPPIKLVGLKLADTIYYDVSDGNHRCTAYERTGHTEIPALVDGIYHLEPEKFTLYRDMLWLENGDMMEGVSFELADDIQEILIQFGVRQYPPKTPV